MYCVHTKVQSAAVQIEDELILATQLASSCICEVRCISSAPLFGKTNSDVFAKIGYIRPGVFLQNSHYS